MSRIKFQDPEELRNKINEFYNWCNDNNKVISVTGLAWFLGTNRMTLLNWINSKNIDNLLTSVDRDIKRECIEILEDAYSYIEFNYEQGLYNKNSCTGSIFTLKNNYNWKDKQEIDTNITSNNIINNMSDEELQAILQQQQQD